MKLFNAVVCFFLYQVIQINCDTDNDAFIVYQFIPWTNHVVNGQVTDVPPLADYLVQNGIYPVNVVYESYFMINNVVDPALVANIAQSAAETPHIPVSFDTEFGDRFQPQTVIPNVTEIINIFHNNNNNTPVGVYGTVPQDTYGWTDNMSEYDQLNPQYAPLASIVDFMSPVLYNYNDNDTVAWINSAKYNMNAARNYNASKPIFPYITPMVGDKSENATKYPNTFLTKREMTLRLETLLKLNASGCIIWVSNEIDTPDGHPPPFDAENGWGNAVVDFVKNHKLIPKSKI